MKTGVIRLEEGLRLVKDGDGYKILPQPYHALAFVPDEDVQTAYDIKQLANSVFYFLLKDKIGDAIHRAKVDIIIAESSDSMSLSFKVEIAKPQAQPQPNIYAVEFTDKSREKYIFNAQNDLVALRAFLGMFDYLSSPLNVKTLASYGIKSLRRLYPGNQWIDVYPTGDEEHDCDCRKVKSYFDNFIR